MNKKGLKVFLKYLCYFIVFFVTSFIAIFLHLGGVDLTVLIIVFYIVGIVSGVCMEKLKHGTPNLGFLEVGYLEPKNKPE